MTDQHDVYQRGETAPPSVLFRFGVFTLLPGVALMLLNLVLIILLLTAGIEVVHPYVLLGVTTLAIILIIVGNASLVVFRRRAIASARANEAINSIDNEHAGEAGYDR